MSLTIASIDLETTGLNHANCQILEFGCILYTVGDLRPVDSMPCLRKRIYWESFMGEPFALRMNADLISQLADRDARNKPDVLPIGALAGHFKQFLLAYGHKANHEGKIKYWPAGKNYAGFDARFLEHVPDWQFTFRPHHRVFDPAILYFDPVVDTDLPPLERCLERAGLSSIVTHQALGDARAVIECLRYKWDKHDPTVQEAGDHRPSSQPSIR